MKNKKRFVPWLIAAVIIAAFAVIGKKLYDLMFGGSLAVTTEDLKNGIIACSPAIMHMMALAPQIRWLLQTSSPLRREM